MTLEDGRSLSAAPAVEICNHGCAASCDRADEFGYADLLLSQGRERTMVATDDAHFSEPEHSGGWGMVKADMLSPDALLAALKDGHFYASQGPQLNNVEITGDALIVESSAVVSVIVQGHGSASQAVQSASMTRTELPLLRYARLLWLRVSVIDAAGKRAWSNLTWRG